MPETLHRNEAWTPEVVNLALQCWSRAKKPQNALELYNSALSIPGLINDQHLVVLFAALQKSDIILDGLAIYKKSREVKISHLGTSANPILASSFLSMCASASPKFCRKNQIILDEAVDVLNQIHTQGLVSHEIPNNLVIMLAGKAGRFDVALNVYDKWRGKLNENGLQLSLHTRKAMMTAANYCQEWSYCVDAYGSILESELRPDSLSIQILLEAYTKLGLREQCLDSFLKWSDAGGVPDWDLVSLLLDRHLVLISFDQPGQLSTTGLTKPPAGDYPTSSSCSVPSSSFDSTSAQLVRKIERARSILFALLKENYGSKSIPPAVPIKLCPEIVAGGLFDKFFGETHLPRDTALTLLHYLIRRGQWRSVASLVERLRTAPGLSKQYRNELETLVLCALLSAGKVDKATQYVRVRMSAIPFDSQGQRDWMQTSSVTAGGSGGPTEARSGVLQWLPMVTELFSTLRQLGYPAEIASVLKVCCAVIVSKEFSLVEFSTAVTTVGAGGDSEPAAGGDRCAQLANVASATVTSSGILLMSAVELCTSASEVLACVNAVLEQLRVAQEERATAGVGMNSDSDSGSNNEYEHSSSDNSSDSKVSTVGCVTAEVEQVGQSTVVGIRIVSGVDSAAPASSIGTSSYGSSEKGTSRGGATVSPTLLEYVRNGLQRSAVPHSERAVVESALIEMVM